MIIWFTGQPGSGKTTLANATIKALLKDNADLKTINLDGDDLRLINKNKDYSKEGRIKKGIGIIIYTYTTILLLFFFQKVIIKYSFTIGLL